ncbi:MAG: NADH:flavin oxidoreductase/NADH oxidase family protein [Lysobacterales bacterium]|nr:MAG: NADH:flavin oxidoreductase/NADH oxidase family protein [Xanthomonadales bacterium]
MAQPFRLPCGVELPNRIYKAAMTEGVADEYLRATAAHERLYRTWSEGGAGLLLTGNVQIDGGDLERPGNVALDPTRPETVSREARDRLARWARSGTVAGNQLWMQISHAGRQSPWYVTREPLAPSPVKLDLLGNFATPRAVTEAEILDFIGRFAAAATLAREAGFTGVQVHGAHGYLVSSFLSPVTNRRADAWGGSLENRARFLLEIVRAVRRAVGTDFPVAVKLNSDDFRKGGFSHEDCLQVVQWLNAESIDALEVSGGTYEQPRLVGAEGRPEDAVPLRASTRAREAYFLDYAGAIRKVARMPLMVTGGFRSRAGMEAALDGGDCDVIGLGRPLVVDPTFVRRLLARETDAAPRAEEGLKFAARGWRSPTSPLVAARMLNTFGAQAWYYCQIFRLAGGRSPELGRGLLSSLYEYVGDELRRARRCRV